jgi:hypothetical protein
MIPNNTHYSLTSNDSALTSLQEVPLLNFDQVAAILTGIIHNFSQAMEKSADIIP